VNLPGQQLQIRLAVIQRKPLAGVAVGERDLPVAAGQQDGVGCGGQADRHRRPSGREGRGLWPVAQGEVHARQQHKTGDDHY